MATREITIQGFTDVIHQNDVVFLDFWAAWCGPCRMFAPVFESASAKHPDIVFGKVDTEDQRELSNAFQISSIPTLMVFREGVLVYSQPGALSAPQLDQLVAEVRNLDMAAVHARIATQTTEQEAVR